MLAVRCDTSDQIYKLCEYCFTQYENTLDESYISIFLEEADDGPQLKAGANDDEIAEYVRARVPYEAQKLSSNPFKVMDIIDQWDKEGGNLHFPARTGHNQKDLIKATAFWNHKNTRRAIRVATAAATLAGIYKYKTQPKTVISKKIAALRKILMKYQKRMQGNILFKEKNILKQICAKIIKAINILLKFIQQKSDKYFG